MAIELVRAPSDTPNISNIDDFIGLRYAYGNQRGYVKGKGTELGYATSGLQFTVTSGRAVIDGAEVDIDANGISITANNTSTKTYYSVYLEVNLNTDTATLKSTNNTTSYPVVSAGDDLTINTTGTANLTLYTFDALSGGTISNVKKIVNAIKYSSEQTVYGANNDGNGVNLALKYLNSKGVISDANSAINNGIYALSSSASNIPEVSDGLLFVTVENGWIFQTWQKNYTHDMFIRHKIKNEDWQPWAGLSAKWATYSTTAGIANYASEDQSKGTIEQRLTDLGFKSGSVSNKSALVSNITLKKLGNFVLCECTVRGSFSFTLPEGFRPYQTKESSVGGASYVYPSGYIGGGGTISIKPDGSVSCNIINADAMGLVPVIFGFSTSANQPF